MKIKEGNGIIKILGEVEEVMDLIKTLSTSLMIKSTKIRVESIMKPIQQVHLEGKEAKR